VEQIFVNASRKYQVAIGSGLLAQAGSLASKVLPACRVLIVTDETVARHYYEPVAASLTACGFGVEKILLHAGEDVRELECAERILNTMANLELTSRDAVLALGSGAVGDVAGFAASVYQRGIAFLAAPTTLRAAVDSSIGGRNGVSLARHERVIGTLWQPKTVLYDLDTVATLSSEQMSDGMAEIIKYAFISDRSFFQQLHDGFDWSDGMSALERVVARCVRVKADYVMRDEAGDGMQRVLEIGKTVAKTAKYCDASLSHGACASIGLSVITRAAERAGLCMPMSGELSRTLQRYQLPDGFDCSQQRFAEAFRCCVGAESETMTLVLPRQIGLVQMVDFTAAKALEFLSGGLQR